MTALESMLRWWRGPVAPDRPAPEPAAPSPRSRVSAKYMALYTYLEHRYASTVVLTFDQMEALLGFSLPANARTEPSWWTDADADGHANAWTVARRIAMPNLPARNVAFERLP